MHVSEAVILYDRESGRSRGLAIVNFADGAGAAAALKLDGEEHMGRYLKISVKKERERSAQRPNHRGGEY